MRLSLILLIILVFGLFITCDAVSRSTSDTVQRRNIVPDTYIVEFDSSFQRRFQNNQVDEFYRQMKSIRVTVQARLNLTSKVFNGASFQLKNQHSVAAVRSLASIREMWPVTVVERTKVKEDGLFSLSEAESNLPVSGKKASYPPHRMTGVDKLHEMGYFGDDVRIAIIDSGIDYKHPDLGGGFGDGFKVSFGSDLVGDDYNGSNEPKPDDDPFTECEAHGTHVTGTIGARGKIFTGVAPNATLGMYRVFGCTGGAANDVLIAAFNKAADLNGKGKPWNHFFSRIANDFHLVHIITASIGGASGWPDNPWALVINRIVESGITCLIAAGNEGDIGPFFGSSGSSALNAIAVASVDSSAAPLLKRKAQYKIRGRRKKYFSYFVSSRELQQDISGFSLKSIDLEHMETADACSPLVFNTESFVEKILLIKFGDCDWTKQKDILESTQINNVIFFGVDDFSFITQRPVFNYGVIKNRLLRLWAIALRKKKSIRIYVPRTVPTEVTYVKNTKSGGQLSYFTSWYPTNDLLFKPDVAGPGGQILSTIPRAMGSYAVFSGTSMATPYLAGIAALYLSAKGFAENITTSQLKNVLLNTATPLNYSFGNQTFSYLAPTAQQGLGLVNALALLKSTTRLDTSTVSLNDTANFNGGISFNITNSGNKTTTYRLNHRGAATFKTFNTLSNESYEFNNLSILIEQYASVILSPSSVTLDPGSTTAINAEFTAPSDVDTELLPVYSGFIEVEGDDAGAQRIGYVGAASSMKDLNLNGPMQANTAFWYHEDGDDMIIRLEENQTVNFTSSSIAIDSALILGSRILRLEVLGTGANITSGGISVVGEVSEFPILSYPRLPGIVGLVFGWRGDLNNEEVLQPGTYNILWRVLKIFGDPNNPDDYYTAKSPTFIVV